MMNQPEARMAKELTAKRADPLAMISSPELLRLRRVSIGTVKWADQPTRKYLPAGLTLTAEDKKLAEKFRDQLLACTVASGHDRKPTLATVTKMLLAYPVSGASQEAGAARAEAYLIALEDIPAWAVEKAIHRWHRGDCGDQNYNFSPPPAILRNISLNEFKPVHEIIEHLDGLVNAIPLDRCMDSRPIEPKFALVPKMRKA